MHPYQAEAAVPARKSMIPLMLALMLALAIVNVLFFVRHSEASERLVKQLHYKDTVIAQLNQQTAHIERQLDSLKITNPKLGRGLDSLRFILLQQEKVIKANLQDQADLNTARQQINTLVAQKQAYFNQIKDLENPWSETGHQLAEALAKNEEMAAEAEEYAASKARQVFRETKDLSPPPPPAYFAIDQLKVRLYPIKHRNRKAKAAAAKGMERIYFCFHVPENQDISAGPETFYIRIIDPKGETLYREDLGSGVQKTNRPAFRYTTSVFHLYGEVAENLCGYWEQPGNSFMKGDYELEVYHRGQLAGKSTFKIP